MNLTILIRWDSVNLVGKDFLSELKYQYAVECEPWNICGYLWHQLWYIWTVWANTLFSRERFLLCWYGNSNNYELIYDGQPIMVDRLCFKGDSSLSYRSNRMLRSYFMSQRHANEGQSGLYSRSCARKHSEDSEYSLLYKRLTRKEVLNVMFFTTWCV